MIDYDAAFAKLGARVRKLRQDRGYSQEDMMAFGFSTRHWQQIEAGRPITLTTLFRAGEALEVRPDKLISGIGNRPKAVSARRRKTRRKSR